MNSKSKVSISICLLLTVSLFIYSAQIPIGYSWSSGTHRFITTKTENVMPSSLSWFFTGYSGTLYTYCTLPDSWKSSDPNEGDRHFYDYDYPHGESQPSHGVLPWAVEDNFNTYVQYLKASDWTHAAQLAGVIAHYIGDASNPLHAEVNYNPGGNHGAYESKVDTEVGLDNVNVDVSGFVPYKLDNIFDSTMQLLAESYSYTSVLNPYLQSGTLWNATIKSLTENRLRSAVRYLANIWYTGMVQAGLVTGSVGISIVSNSQSGSNGAVLTYTVKVNNTENASDNFNLAASDNASWNPTVSPTSLAIPSGENRTATLSVTVPSNAVGGTIDNMSVTANGNGGSGSASCTAHVTIVRSVNVSISPGSQSGANGAMLNYTVTVYDTGNVSDNYSLTPTDNSGWPRSVSPTSIVVAAFGNGNATLTVTVSSSAIGGTVDNVKVTANGTGDNGSSTCTSQVTINRGVNASISPTSQSGANGTTLTYTVTVHNTGNVSDNYALTTSDNTGWSRNISPTSLAVAAFSSDNTTTLSVTIPSSAMGGAIDNVKVNAAGTGDNSSANCIGQVTISRGVNVSISPSSQSGANGATLTYTVTVNNTGNVSDNYSFTVTDNSGWSRSVLPTSIVVPAFNSNNTTVMSVTIPSNAIGGTVDNVNTTATGTGDNSSASCIGQVTIARSVSVSILPSIQENENGGMLAYTVKVNNTGNVQENFQLVKGDNAGWTPSLDNAWLVVPNGENRITKLNVTIPPDAPVSTRDNIWVQANSQDNTAVFDNKSCLAQVRGIGAEINLVAGWNLVCFAEVGSSDTPNNLFTGLNYYTDYYVYYWSAPNGPYNVQDPNTTFHDNIGYWIWIDQDKTVLTSGSPVASRDVYLVTGWDLVGLPVVNSGTTPDNIFAPLTYYTDYIIYYWSAPSGPYNVQDPDQVFENVLGYWVWINQDRMVTVP